jgi:DNA invertase Pin-like site-specific DNA recombinase
MSVAAWEREAIGERTKTALQHKISRRERVGAVRFGFDLADDGCSLLENIREQEAIALMIELRKAGRSLRAIAVELNGHAIPTKAGNATWTHTAVAYILRRQVAA